MNQQGLLISYRYDALDRLIGIEPVAASATTRVYRDGRLAAQLEEGRQHSLIEAGGYLLAQSTRSEGSIVNNLLGCDQQRSVLQSVSADQIHHMAYTPYGAGVGEGGIQSLLGFNGEPADPITGCYMLGNGYRAYNPELMRFHSPDSMSPFDSGGINPYAYGLGDPINMSDPTGHFSWKAILSIAISVAAIALTAVTLGVGAPLTGPLIFASVVGIIGEVLSIASEVVTQLAPDSKVGPALGQLSLGLAVLSIGSPRAAKFAASSASQAASRFFTKGTVSVARQGAVRVSNGQALKSLRGVAKLGKGARNTVAVQNRLDVAAQALKYVKYAGYAAKGYYYTDLYVVPYLAPPATGQSEQRPSTFDTFVRGDADQAADGLGQLNIKLGDFLTADASQEQDIREF